MSGGGHCAASGLGQLGLLLSAFQSTGDLAACQEACYQNNCLRSFQAKREKHSRRMEKQSWKLAVTKKVLGKQKWQSMMGGREIKKNIIYS